MSYNINTNAIGYTMIVALHTSNLGRLLFRLCSRY